jgi:hypothetical protein
MNLDATRLILYIRASPRDLPLAKRIRSFYPHPVFRAEAGSRECAEHGEDEGCKAETNYQNKRPLKNAWILLQVTRAMRTEA